jgi:hypothetical protein
LLAVNFNEGKRYSDFNSSDKVAAYPRGAGRGMALKKLGCSPSSKFAADHRWGGCRWRCRREVLQGTQRQRMIEARRLRAG